MRILHILDHSAPLHSGYTFRTLSVLTEQRALGYETFHITSAKQGSGSLLEEQVNGWHFYRTPSLEEHGAALPVLNQIATITGLTRRLADVVRTCQPDILHAHSPVLNAIAALRIGQPLGIPVVYEVRAFWEDAAVDHGTHREWGMRYRLARGLETYALRRVHAVTTICDGLKTELLGRGLRSDKITVIPNAVNVDDFTGAVHPDLPLARQLGLDGKIVLGFIGSFYAYEGLDLLLQALPVMLREHPNLRVLLAGGGPQEAELKRLAGNWGIADKVVFVGRIPHTHISQYYQLIDVLVYPRQKMRLTDLVTPLKPLEAMAQNKLVVASDVGGHRELISDGETGVLFTAGDAAALAREVLSLLAHRQQWPRLTQQGRHFVESQRTWKASVQGYRAVYDGLCQVNTR